MWCVENYVPLRQLKEQDALIVFYEHLCTDFQNQARILLDYMGQSFDSRVKKIAKTPSLTSTNNSAITMGKRPLDAWIYRVAEDQTRATMQILSLFGLDRIYGPSPWPRVTTGQDVFKLQWQDRLIDGPQPMSHYRERTT